MGQQRRLSNKRMSLAPSVIMAPGAMEADVADRGSAAKEFICSHVKTIVTVIMIFGTISVIVLIVMGEYSAFLFTFIGGCIQRDAMVGSRWDFAWAGVTPDAMSAASQRRSKGGASLVTAQSSVVRRMQVDFL